jgi:hypothetical protein
MIRFTPRKPGSIWSLVNIRRAEELEAEGLLEPAGRGAFAKRDRARAETYSYERATSGFDSELEAEFRRNARAWKYFDAQPPYYRRLCTHWVVSAKQEATRQRRLATLIAHSQAGERLPQIFLNVVGEGAQGREIDTANPRGGETALVMLAREPVNDPEKPGKRFSRSCRRREQDGAPRGDVWKAEPLGLGRGAEGLAKPLRHGWVQDVLKCAILLHRHGYVGELARARILAGLSR